jgi:hypothetical protein
MYRRWAILIEDKIQALRQAAKISDERRSDQLSCIVVSNELGDDIVYAAISSKNKRLKILFRESITLEESRVHKKFDLIMLYGDANKIRELSHACKEKGGAYIKIDPLYLDNEINFMLIIAPDNAIKKFVSAVERKNYQFSILLEDQTTGFIEADLQLGVKLPNFLQDILAPLFDISDVSLSIVLVSIENEEDIVRIKRLASKNIFIKDFKRCSN